MSYLKYFTLLFRFRYGYTVNTIKWPHLCSLTDGQTYKQVIPCVFLPNSMSNSLVGLLLTMLSKRFDFVVLTFLFLLLRTA